MIEIIAIIIVLWLIGIIRIPWLVLPDFPVVTILGYTITIHDLLVIGIIIWLTSSLGSPFRQMLWAFAILWGLTTIGIIAIGGMMNVILISVVVGLVLSAVQRN